LSPTIATAASGTWTDTTSGGLWSAAGNWLGGTAANVANGADATADFSTLNIMADNTVHLDTAARTIGQLLFGDTTPSHSWILDDNNSSGENKLTLAVASGSPTVSCATANAEISLILAGTQGLTKTGADTLMLSGANIYTGVTVINVGTVKVGNAAAFGGTADGTTIASGATVDLNGQALGAENITSIQGTGVGNNGALINSSGTAASLAGNVTLAGDTTVGGSGDTSLSGAVGGPNHVLTKSGTGTLTLSGSTDNGGLGMAVNGGTVILAKTTSSSPNVHAVGAPGLTINGGTAQLAGTGDDQIYTTATVTDNGTLDMNGRNEGFQALLGFGDVTNSSNTPSVLTLGENTQSSDSATFSGALSGGDNNLALIKTGAGALTLSGGGDNHFLRATVNSGTLILAKSSGTDVHALGGSGTALTVNQGGSVQLAGTGDDQIYDTSNVALNGTLDLNGHSENFDGLTGSGLVTNTQSGALSRLILGQNSNAEGPAMFSGRITDGQGQVALTKVGDGIQILSGTNTFSGLTLILGGTLELASTPALPMGNSIALGNGSTLVIDADSVAGSVQSISGTTTLVAGVSLIANSFSLQGPGGGLGLQLAGQTPALNSKLQVSGAVNLAGALTVSLVNNFQPRLGDSFDLMDWGSLSGTFSTLSLPTLSGLAWDTTRLYTSGVISVVSNGIPGDYNRNGVVDAADYTLWRDTLGQSVSAYSGADGNGNGVIDAGDYDVWKTHFGEHAGSGAGARTNTAVPEPATPVLLLVGTVTLWLRRRASVP
jgi:autotransporter-associated beta strand protein